MRAWVTSEWISSAAGWLTPRRIRAHAVFLAICLWGVCAVDFATPGLFDRAGNIKFQDFLQFYISARLIAEGRTGQLYDQQVAFDELRAIVYPENPNRPTRVRLPAIYGPQVGFLFVPLAHLSFGAVARLWVAFSVAIYFACVYLIWRCCSQLRGQGSLVIIAALAFPPFFHFFVRGQISVLLLGCFTAAFLAFRAERNWLGGFAGGLLVGFLVFKPQFLIAIPLVLLLARAWGALGGTMLAAIAQLGFTWSYFGTSVLRAYFDTMLHMSRWMKLAEPVLAPVQMHSLRSFWTLLVPWPQAALSLYLLSSIAVIAIAAAIWKSSPDLAVRFSSLILAAVLVNPHLFIYDLLVLAPAFLLLADWIASHASQAIHQDRVNALKLGLCLAFLLPLFGPLARWTHLQLSVPAFAVLLWTLWRLSGDATAGHKLAPEDSPVV